MSRLSLLSAVLAIPIPLSAYAAPQPEGRIVSDEARIEILGRPVRVGERIQLPEGFLRVEEKGTEDEQVGSFGVIASETLVAVAPTPPAMGGSADPAAAADGARRCHAERSAYIAELWEQSGIHVSDPAALLAGLDGGATGPLTGFSWFALATDPFRPLAWSSELRARAEALARCVGGQ